VKSKDFSALPAAKVRFVEPMYALAVQKLPQGQEWLYEVKFDGYRCLAGRDSAGVTLWSRRGNLFTNQFPRIARACERLPPGTLVDGAIVPWIEAGTPPSISSNITVESAGVALLSWLPRSSSPNGRRRYSKFVGLREDKEAQEVVREG
jgi:ATP dependent DNA ligase domain